MKYFNSIFSNYFGSYINFIGGVHRTFSYTVVIVIRSLCLLRARNMEAVDTSWLFSTAIVSARVAEKKVKVQILAFHIMIVLGLQTSPKMSLDSSF